jgi:Ubiquitin family
MNDNPLVSPKSPRTPKRSPQKKKTLSSGGRSESERRLIMSPSFTPKGWEVKQSFLVYEKPKDDSKRIANVEGRNQGIWTKGYVAAQNPQELWVFKLGEEPTDFSSHIHGVWGYKPGGDPDDPNDVWFYPPNFNDDYSGKDAERLPSYFTQQGVWTYPLVKRNVTEIAPEETGWLGVGHTVKMEKLDVGGTWKMMYKQGALKDDTPKGPGMKSRSPKSAKSTPTSQRKKKKDISHMTIIVETPDGKQISMKVLPTDTVGDVKSKVEKQEAISVTEQRLLSPDGALLEDPNDTLGSHSIQNGDILRLQGMRVRIKNNSGNDRADDIFVIDNLTPGVSVAALKKRIEDQECINAEDQLLSHHGKFLHDPNTLEHYGVEHEDTLELEPMVIRVRDNGKAYSLGNGLVFPTSTIDEIKVLLNDVHDLPPPEYLRLSHDDDLLDDGSKTLNDCGIPHKGTLDVEPIHLRVETPDGSSVEVRAHPRDSILKVKQLVEGKECIPVSEQRLSFNGRTLQDPKELLHYGINHGDTITLGGMQIHVQHFNGNTITLDVIGTNTVLDIKEMIQGIEGTPVEEQFPSFGAKNLKDDGRTLSSYNIKHGAMLKLEKMKIFIQSTDGKFPLYVSPTTPMKELKQMIEKKTSIKPKDQVIRFQGADVGGDDGATISDHGIRHRDTLEVENGGAKADPIYMVQVSEYRDAFSYNPSPKKSKSPSAGRKVARNKASSAGATAFGNFFETSKMADREAGSWNHKTVPS